MNSMTDISQLRIPPYSAEAESAVLGTLLLNEAAWDRCSCILTADDFYRHENKQIFAVISQLSLANKPADVITVFDRLQASGKADDVGGLAYINGLAQYVASAGNLQRYAEIIRERSLSRKLVQAGDAIGSLGFDQSEPIADRIDQASAQLLALIETRGDADWVGMDELLPAFLDRTSDLASGDIKDDAIPTGIHALDEILEGGFRPGQLIIIGARPSIGKSALAVSCSTNSAKTGVREGIFSLEMPKEELIQRQISMLSGIHLSNVRRPERLRPHEWPLLTEAVEKLRMLPLYVAEQSGPNINQIRAKARALRRRHGLQKLTVDYLGLTTGTNTKEPRHQQLGEVSRGLKNLAKELGIPIVALAQLGRGLEQRTNGRPMLSDLKDSGDIEQDADVVIFIDRPYHGNQTLGSDWEHYAELIVAKQRNGATGSVNARYIGKNVLFTDWEGEKPSKAGRSSRSDL